MYYTVYKITNQINNKIYIGVHKTDNLDDGYMGSGIVLRRAINKYGADNFTKEYIKVFDNTDDMFNMESELVNEEFIKRPDTYNLKEGGFGGFDYINEQGFDRKPEIGGKALQKKVKNNKELKEKYRKMSIKALEKANESYNPRRKGKANTAEHNRKIGEANSKHQTGKGNSNYGKCWIYHPELKQSKPVPRFELPQWEDKGWIKGRKIKVD